MASCAKHWHFVYSPQSSFMFFIQRKIMAFLQRCIQLFLTIRAVRLNLRWSHRGVWLSWHFVLIEVVTNKNYIYIYDDPNIWFPPCVRLTELNPHKGPNIYQSISQNKRCSVHTGTFFMSCEVCSWRFFCITTRNHWVQAQATSFAGATVPHVHCTCQRFADCFVGLKHDKHPSSHLKKKGGHLPISKDLKCQRGKSLKDTGGSFFTMVIPIPTWYTPKSIFTGILLMETKTRFSHLHHTKILGYTKKNSTCFLIQQYDITIYNTY